MQEVIQMCSTFEGSKSTKGASKLRRDLINAEISNLRDLLPLPSSTRQRLSQLQLMALVCVYVRKANYFQQAFKRLHELGHPYCTPNIGFSKALNGFLIMMTQNGKLLYISDNAAEYLGHSMEDLLIHGDSVYDIIDKGDHGTVQSELLRSTNAQNPPGDDTRVFLCRMNVSRNARRQMRFGDQKVVLVQGRYLSYLPLCSRNEPVFVANCTPVAMPETRECVVQGATNVFTTVHAMDMKFMHIDRNGEYYLGYNRTQLAGISWYQLIHWNFMREAQNKHRLISESEQEKSCILLLRLQTRAGEWLWIHCVLQVKDNSTSSNSSANGNSPESNHTSSHPQSVIMATNQVLSDREAGIMQANQWLYHYYTVQTKLQYGLAYPDAAIAAAASQGSPSAASAAAAVAAARLAATAYFPSPPPSSHGHHHLMTYGAYGTAQHATAAAAAAFQQQMDPRNPYHSASSHGMGLSQSNGNTPTYYHTHAAAAHYELAVGKETPLDFSLASASFPFDWHASSHHHHHHGHHPHHHQYAGSGNAETTGVNCSYWGGGSQAQQHAATGQSHSYSGIGAGATTLNNNNYQSLSLSPVTQNQSGSGISNQKQSNQGVILPPKKSISPALKNAGSTTKSVMSSSSGSQGRPRLSKSLSSVSHHKRPKKSLEDDQSEEVGSSKHKPLPLASSAQVSELMSREGSTGETCIASTAPFPYHSRGRSLFKPSMVGENHQVDYQYPVKEETANLLALGCPLTPSPVWEGQSQRVPDLHHHHSSSYPGNSPGTSGAVTGSYTSTPTIVPLSSGGTPLHCVPNYQPYMNHSAFNSASSVHSSAMSGTPAPPYPFGMSYFGSSGIPHSHNEALYMNSSSLSQNGSPNKENRLPPTPESSDNGDNDENRPIKWESL